LLYKIGVDLGGTKTEIIVLDENLHVLERKRVILLKIIMMKLSIQLKL